MTMVGADPGELIALAKKMDQDAADLDHRIRIPMRMAVGSSPWAGHDAVRFRHDWATTLDPQLAKTAAALHTAAQVLRRNAQEQFAASAGDGALASASGVATGRLNKLSEGAGADPPMKGSWWVDIPHQMFGVVDAWGDNEMARWFRGMSDAPDDMSWAEYIAIGKEADKWSELIDSIGIGVDGVSFLVSASELSTGVGTWADVFDLAADGASVISGVAGWAGNAGLGAVFGPLGQGLGIVSDVAEAYEAAQSGDWLGAVYHGAHAAVRGVGMVHPGVALGLAVFDAGLAIGSSPIVQQFTVDALQGAGDVANSVGKVLGEAAGSAGKAVGNVAKGAADALGGFVGGLFGGGLK
ncbi:MAG: hypothetical protein QM286_05375 [Acidobacteriota bacterium]|nr:hypothetical protein [Acidobacteriota bacterium]